MEVMGLMLGEFVDDYTVRCTDVFAMPQSGTGVSVEAVDPVFQTKMLDMLKQTGRYAPSRGWPSDTPTRTPVNVAPVKLFLGAPPCGVSCSRAPRIVVRRFIHRLGASPWSRLLCETPDGYALRCSTVGYNCGVVPSIVVGRFFHRLQASLRGFCRVMGGTLVALFLSVQHRMVFLCPRPPIAVGCSLYHPRSSLRTLSIDALTNAGTRPAYTHTAASFGTCS